MEARAVHRRPLRRGRGHQERRRKPCHREDPGETAADFQPISSTRPSRQHAGHSRAVSGATVRAEDVAAHSNGGFVRAAQGRVLAFGDHGNRHTDLHRTISADRRPAWRCCAMSRRVPTSIGPTAWRVMSAPPASESLDSLRTRWRSRRHRCIQQSAAVSGLQVLCRSGGGLHGDLPAEFTDAAHGTAFRRHRQRCGHSARRTEHHCRRTRRGAGAYPASWHRQSQHDGFGSGRSASDEPGGPGTEGCRARTRRQVTGHRPSRYRPRRHFNVPARAIPAQRRTGLPVPDATAGTCLPVRRLRGRSAHGLRANPGR